MLEESFKRDQSDSIKLLCKQSDAFETEGDFRTTPLDIAYEIDHCPSFISHESVQHLLSSIWTGNMPIETTAKHIFMILFIPFYFYSFKFDEEDIIKYKIEVEDVDTTDW